VVSIVGVVAGLARYPVKSVLGEELDEAELEARGVVGDRCWAFYTEDGGIGSGKTSQRFRRVDGLLGLRSSLTGDVPELHLPDGRTVRVDDPGAGEVLGGLLGRAVTLRRETTVPHHDDAPVHLVTTAGLRALGTETGREVDPVRFRANLVLDVEGAGYAEDRWVGRELAVGDEVVLGIEFGMPRCVMVDAVHDGLPAEPRVLTTLGRTHDVEFGLAATVARGGTIRRGDAARLVEAG
jgi:uncharacterized protein YcbX